MSTLSSALSGTSLITNDDPQYEVGVISGLLTEILVDSDRSAASALESGNRKCAHTGVHKNMGNSVADDDHGWGKKKLLTSLFYQKAAVASSFDLFLFTFLIIS